jgi:hypothetical protein
MCLFKCLFPYLGRLFPEKGTTARHELEGIGIEYEIFTMLQNSRFIHVVYTLPIKYCNANQFFSNADLTVLYEIDISLSPNNTYFVPVFFKYISASCNLNIFRITCFLNILSIISHFLSRNWLYFSFNISHKIELSCCV